MKKVLSLVLVIAMVLSSMSFAFASTFSDTAESDYEEAIETLKALGVIDGYEDGTFKPEKTVTRAEMAKLMVQLLGYGNLTAGQKSSFTDTQGHWADAWIAIAAGRGIVVGTGNGKFTPDATVTYDQVLTMLVRGLGYTDNCNELKNMTWPTNFKVKAAELNITKNVDMTSNDADRGGVAQAMRNALDQQIVKINSDGDVEKQYKTADTRNEEKPIKLISMVAAEKTLDPVSFDHLDPDSKDYAGNKVDLSPYLFQKVTVYCNRNNDDEVVYIDDSDSVTYSDTVDTVTPVNSGKDVELEIGDYTFTVSANFSDVSFNNDQVGIDDITPLTDLEDARATVVFDEDEARVKDDAEVAGIVFEKASAYVQVEEEYTADATEIDEIYLPEKSDKVDSGNLIITGDATELSDIKADDIVAAYAPYDDGDPTVDTPDKLKLVVTRKTVEGKITGTADEAYYIDRTKYDVNDALGVIADVGDDEVGTEGTFYLDDEGKVIAFAGDSESSKTYAVIDEVYSGRYEETDSTNHKARVITAPRIKLDNSSDETVTYDFDLDIVWNTSKSAYEVDGDLKDLFTVTAPDGTFKEGKISYKVPTNKLVSYTIDGTDIDTIEEAGRAITDVKTDSKSFALASNVVIFNADGDVIAESKLGSEVTGYAVYKNGKIVALYATSSEEEGTYYYAYINSVYPDTDEDDDEVLRIDAYIQGAQNKKLFTDDDDTISKSVKDKLYVLDLNDEDVVQGHKGEITIDKSKAVTASAINSSSGKLTVKENGVNKNIYFDDGAATIIKIETDDDVESVGKISAIKANDTQFLYFYNITGYDTNGDPEYSNDTVGFIVIIEK